MTTDAALARIRAAGWRVNNLFERDGGTWQANLRRPGQDARGVAFTEFAYGSTAAAALAACVEKLGGLPAAPSVTDLL